MSVQVENLEKSMAKLTIEVAADEFEAALNKAYQKSKNKINLPGFRKGKAPRAMIEKMYGAGIFVEDAANIIIPDAYESAAKESELEIVAQPEIAVEQAEKGKPFIFTATVAIKPDVTRTFFNTSGYAFKSFLSSESFAFFSSITSININEVRTPSPVTAYLLKII